MKTTSPADKKRVETVITRIAEDRLRKESPESYPKDYTLGWCIDAVRKFKTKMAFAATVIITLTLIGAIGLFKVTSNRGGGWLAGLFLLVIICFLIIALVEKIISPGEKVENLAYDVRKFKLSVFCLGKEFKDELCFTSPDRTSMCGNNIQTLENDVNRAIETVLVRMIAKYLDLEGRGAFGMRSLRKKLGRLHHRAVSLKFGVNKDIGVYFDKARSSVVIFHEVRI